MDVITLTAVKDNIFDFTLDIQGMDNLEGLRVQLVLHCNGIHYGFDCKRDGPENKFTVTIPPLPHVERSAYQYSIEVVADGYHFTPVTGTANFTQDPFVSGTRPEIRTSVTPPAQRIHVPEKVITRHSEKSIRQIAEEVTAANKAGVTSEVVDRIASEKISKTSVEKIKKIQRSSLLKELAVSEKDNLVLSILESVKDSKPTVKRVLQKTWSPKRQKVTESSRAIDSKKDEEVRNILDGINHSVDEKIPQSKLKKGKVIEH